MTAIPLYVLLQLVCIHTYIFFLLHTCKCRVLGHRSRRLQWPIVITRCPASVVRRPLDNLHFQLLLQNPLMDFDETWYGWRTQGPLQALLFFGQRRQGVDPGRGQNRSRGSPSSKNFFFRPESYSNKPNAYQWSRSIWKEVLLFLVSFGSQIFDVFWLLFGLSHFALF